MAVLIFRRPMHAQNALPYSVWLRDLDEPIVLFTMGCEPEDAHFAHVERLDSFDAHGLTEIRAVELGERFPFTRVFAQSEHDILRGARLREWFGLAGQSYDCALAYREKVYMKALAAAGGVETPPFAALSDPLDLYRFAADHGYPLVIKPRDGSGSRGVRVVESASDLRRFLEHRLPEHHMVEGYVAGPTFHVDGLATGGRILFTSVSRYFNSSLSFHSGESNGSLLLDPSQPLSQRLVAMTGKVVGVLPPAPHLAFHAEFFLDATDRLLFCEIASRPGGSRIAEVIEVAYGVNMYQQWVRRSFGLPIELPPPRPWTAVGRLFIPPRRGCLRSLPESVPFEWADYRPNSAPGQCWDDPAAISTHVASFVVRGRDTEQVESRMRSLDGWFRHQAAWEDSPRPVQLEGDLRR